MTSFESTSTGFAPAHRAMWMSTIRQSLERSVPIATDDMFSDLLAELDRIPVDRSRRGPAQAEPAFVAARRDAARVARLAGYVELLNDALDRGRNSLGAGASPQVA